MDVILEVGKRVKSKIVSTFYNWCQNILNQLKNDNESNIVTFRKGDLVIDARISPEENTVYLSRNEIAILFETTKQNVSSHIKNIIDDGELTFGATVKNYLTVQIEGERETTREIECLNLDMILAIGYRIRSKTAILFRRWASDVLKRYLVKGYAIDEKRTLVTNENYVNLINKVDSLESRIDVIEERQKHLFIENKVIFEDKVFDASILINRIVETAKRTIALIDPCVDIRTLDAFKNKNENVLLIIITSKENRISENEKESFNYSYGDLFIYIDDRYHDRYLIIDDYFFYHLGSSINYLGRRFSQITLVPDGDIKSTLHERIKNYLP